MFKSFLSALVVALTISFMSGPALQNLQAWTFDAELLDAKASSISFEAIAYENLSAAQLKLVDQKGKALPDIGVEIYASHPEVDIFQGQSLSDANGVLEFWVLAHTKEPFKIMAKERLSQTIIDKIYTLQAGATTAQDDFSLQLASEVGPVDHFEISIDSDILLIGETQSFTVKAVDADNNIVRDYTGTIRFSSSDSQAELPADFNFKAEHSGEQSFRLGLRFITPGTHTLEVRDIENFSLTGSKDLKVVMDASFDTEASDTTGTNSSDSFLTSPASGQYSSAEIQISGTANYGETIRVLVDNKEISKIPVEFNKNSFEFTLKNIPDGPHTLIVERYLEEKLLEASEPVLLNVDSTAPKIIQITAIQDPLKPSEQKLEILSEAKLTDAYVLYGTELFPLIESKSTPGKYEVSLPSPSEATPIDVILVDTLGNESEIKNAIILEAQASVPETSSAISTILVRAGEGSAILSWEKPVIAQAIAYYKIHYGPSRDSMFASVDTLDASSLWTIQELPAGEEVFISIQTVDVLGELGPKSEIVSTIPLKNSRYEIPKDLGLSLNEGPLYDDLKNKPTQTADSGSSVWALIILSFLTTILYTKKKSLL